MESCAIGVSCLQDLLQNFNALARRLPIKDGTLFGFLKLAPRLHLDLGVVELYGTTCNLQCHLWFSLCAWDGSRLLIKVLLICSATRWLNASWLSRTGSNPLRKHQRQGNTCSWSWRRYRPPSDPMDSLPLPFVSLKTSLPLADYGKAVNNDDNLIKSSSLYFIDFQFKLTFLKFELKVCQTCNV